jgi:uncharacterized protein YegL
MVGFGGTKERKLNLYLLIDNSASMHGAPLHAVSDSAFPRTLRLIDSVFGPPAACSLLTYNSAVHIHSRRSHTCTLPQLTGQGTSALGHAWEQLAGWMSEDDDGGRLALLFTDGPGTDNWVAAGERLAGMTHVMVGIGCGRRADLSLLDPYLDRIVYWSEENEPSMRQMLTRLAGGG